jgi:hypothetical protein
MRNIGTRSLQQPTACQESSCARQLFPDWPFFSPFCQSLPYPPIHTPARLASARHYYPSACRVSNETALSCSPRGFLARGVAPLLGRLGKGLGTQPPRGVGQSGEAIYRAKDSTPTCSSHSNTRVSRSTCLIPAQIAGHAGRGGWLGPRLRRAIPRTSLGNMRGAWGFVDRGAPQFLPQISRGAFGDSPELGTYLGGSSLARMV